MIEINKFVRNEEVLSKRGGFAGGYTQYPQANPQFPQVHHFSRETPTFLVPLTIVSVIVHPLFGPSGKPEFPTKPAKFTNYLRPPQYSTFCVFHDGRLIARLPRRKP